MKVDFNRFFESLKYMGVGMVCIFVVIGVIALATYLLNKITSPKKTATDELTDSEEE